MPRRHRAANVFPWLLAAAACRGPAYGSENAVIAVVDPVLRESLEPVIRQSFEREVFTTRPEPVFEVTFASTEAIGEFRKWKRIVVFELADGDATLVPELLRGDDLGRARTDGVVAQVDEKWARDQTIWVVAAPTAEATAELARASVNSLYEILHDLYVASEVAQMWASEPDSALAEQLLDSLGFALVLPRVYTPAPGSAPPNTLTFYNEEPRRIVSIHWGPAPGEIPPDTVLAIRRAWGESIFPGDSIPASIPSPVADTTAAAPGGGAPRDTTASGGGAPEDTTAIAPPPLLVSRTTLAGRPAVRLQGVWQNPRDHTAGVFLTYGVSCGDQLVLLDGNVFAPERPKYPYLVQLERIFDTFRCARDR